MKTIYFTDYYLEVDEEETIIAVHSAPLEDTPTYKVKATELQAVKLGHTKISDLNPDDYEVVE
jgi:hypothetical protein